MPRGPRSSGRGRPGALARALLLASLAACAPDGARGGFVLFGHLAQADELVIGADDAWAREAAQRMAPRLEAELGLRVGTRSLRQASPGARRVRMLLGYADSPDLRTALQRLDVQAVDPTRIRIGEHEYGGRSGGAFVATLPDPRHGDAPLTIFVALEEHDPVGSACANLDVARELRPTWRTGWQVWDESGLLVAQGGLGPQGHALPDVGPERSVPLPRPLGEWADEATQAELGPAQDLALRGVLEVLGPAPTLEGFDPLVRVHRHPEELALAARTWRAYRCAPASGVVDLVIAPELFVDARAAFAELYARRDAGLPRQPWMLEGLVRHVAQTWWGMDLERWCAHLQRAGLVPPLEELVSPAPRRSPHAVAPLRGLLFEVLLETRGADEVRRLWREGGLALDEPLRAAFRVRLEALARRYGEELERARTARRAQVLARPFRKGVALVGGRRRDDALDSGLGSASGRQALERIAARGADAVSLDVVSYAEAPWRAFALEPRLSALAQVDDLELYAACAEAGAHDLSVLLKLALWLSPDSTLAGEALVHSAQELRRFFDALELQLEHYTLLAELSGVELVCVASELRNAAPARGAAPDEDWGGDRAEWMRTRWTDALARARAAFGGGLTYAARWDQPLESFALWGLFDFIGVDLFPPLVTEAEEGLPPRLPRISRQLERVLAGLETTAASLGKRLLVVEVGFPSTHDAWRDPDEPGGAADETAQGLFLTALAGQRRYWDRRQSSIAGLYVWCWSAEPDGGPGGERDHTLQGKLGEVALQRVFSEP